MTDSKHDPKDRVEIDRLAEALTAAWNAADGVAFAEMFTEDADSVNIRDDHFVGRDTLAGIPSDVRITFGGQTLIGKLLPASQPSLDPRRRRDYGAISGSLATH